MATTEPTPITLAGSSLTLSCTATNVVELLVVEPTLQWLDALNTSVVLNSTSNMMSLDLTFPTLRTSHGGQYMCVTTINISSIKVEIQDSSIESLMVLSKFWLLSFFFVQY